MRIHKAGEDRRFRTIKTNFTRFLMTWTLQGMWVSMCLLCVLTALSSYNGIIINNVFYIGLLMFILGFLTTKNKDKIVYILKIQLLRVKEFFENQLLIN